MRDLKLILPSLTPATPNNPWREAVFFLITFVTVLLSSAVVVDHVAAVLF
ncbi:MAG: hypothetical protein V4701_01430 [Pseudomonadota bacterium]